MAIDTERCIQARMREFLQKAPALTRTLQAGRAVLRFGPWHHAVRAVIRRKNPPRLATATPTLTCFKLDTTQLVLNLRTNGIAMAGQLPPEVLCRVRAVTDELPPGEYGEFQELPDIRALVQCGNVLGVARGYLGAEPALLECNLVVAHAEDPAIVEIDSQRLFHFDYAGWHSLNLFVYLTDVKDDSGAHQVVAGTHRARNVWDAIRSSVPAEQIKARYPGRVRTIIGPAGTMFFEDTAAFHRRRIVTRRRVLLNILYASHRSWLSKGRLVPRYSDYLQSRAAVRWAAGTLGRELCLSSILSG